MIDKPRNLDSSEMRSGRIAVGVRWDPGKENVSKGSFYEAGVALAPDTARYLEFYIIDIMRN